jgi:Zn-dependent M28 family amino/carboxypeptidase
MKAAFEPSRTVQFMAFAAEEVGLRGSQDIAEAYARENIAVYSMMQFDMVRPAEQSAGRPTPRVSFLRVSPRRLDTQAPRTPIQRPLA